MSSARRIVTQVSKPSTRQSVLEVPRVLEREVVEACASKYANLLQGRAVVLYIASRWRWSGGHDTVMRECIGRIGNHGQREVTTERESCEGSSSLFSVYRVGRLNPRDEILLIVGSDRIVEAGEAS